ncbi:uncharacterized protein PG998_010249 [Apiospora kogelbergensis]|uniref:uncharacterized protein n=1 Tax=Apiospora kogelbergensis TaxID=1337665 RepID=UPI00312EBA79
MASLLILTPVILLLLLWIASLMPGGRAKNLPPGPRTLPFLGNMHMIPRRRLDLKFSQLAKIYGPVFSLKVGSGTMVVFNSAKPAIEVMDKQSLYSSNRPPSSILSHGVFRGNHPMYMAPAERWKLRRKLYHQILQESVLNKLYIPLIEAESCQLVRDVCSKPEDLMLHPGRYSNSVIMSLVFGIRTPSHDMPHYLQLRQVMTKILSLGEIGATPPIDLFPFLQYLPERLWGNWKTRAQDLRETALGLYGPLVDQVMTRRSMGKRLETFLDGVLDQNDKLGLSREEIDVMCGNLLEGGTDTTGTLIMTLWQAMALHPHVLAETHAQIDSVLDESTMPTWADYERLPIVSMIVKELQRWRPPARGGFPHAMDKDVVVDGMTVPQGATVIINSWSAHMDPERWDRPQEFDPWRYRDQTQLASVYANSRDPLKRDHFGYGIGRRICPGIHLAERTFWLAMARVLWAFDIRPQVDAATGKPVPIDVDPVTGYTDGFVNQCLPFEVDCKIRSEKRRETIFRGELLHAFD